MDDYASFWEGNGRPTSGFMFSVYHLYAVPGPNVPLHWHEEIEIMLPKTDGVLILDGYKIDFHCNDILFFNSRQLHDTYHIKPGWSHHILVHPELLGSHNLLDSKNGKYMFPEKIEAEDKTCLKIIESILERSDTINDAGKLYIIGRLFDLMYYLTDNGFPVINNETPMVSPTGIGYVKHSLEFIHHNLNQKLSVQRVADEIGISKEYLMRLFKQYTGETINSYMQDKRIEAAKNDLISGLSLTDIVFKYNYSDVAYFCRLFKNHYGISPGKYKMERTHEI